MPQLPAGVLYGVPALLAGQIVLTMAEQIPADAGWAGFAAGLLGTAGVMLMVFGARQIRPGWRLSILFGSGGFLELFGEHFLDSMPVLAWPRVDGRRRSLDRRLAGRGARRLASGSPAVRAP